MKKLLLSLGAFILAFSVYAQPVSDNATIPVSITLNSILRLNVTSGGNIEFAFNTLKDYKSGIGTGSNSQYTTNFVVASSSNFAVTLSVEDATFLGSDNSANQMALNFVAHTVAASGGNSAFHTLSAAQEDLADGTVIITNNGGNAGDITENIFSMAWECGTSGTGGGTLLGSTVKPDRYSTNVYLVLSKL